MKSKNIDLFKILSEKFLDDVANTQRDKDGNMDWCTGYNSDNKYNKCYTCRTTLKKEAKLLRKILLGILEEM